MVFGEVLSVFRALAPFLRSHHPLCSFYNNDTYNILGRRICMGCSISYPLALILIISTLITRSYRYIPEPQFHQSVLLGTSVLFGLFHMMKYLIRSEGRITRLAAKVSLSFSLAGLIVWALTIPARLQIILLFIFLIIVSISFMGTLRLYYFYRTCAGCIYHGDWDLCFGFRGLNRYHAIKDIKPGRRLHELMFDKKRRKRISD